MRFLKQSFPRQWEFLSRSYHQLLSDWNRLQWRFGSMEQKFSKIHDHGLWGSSESVSGPGSQLDQTLHLRKALPAFLGELALKSMLDVPCGDFNWMRNLALPVEHYIGADIVESLVKRNQAEYGNAQRSFLKLDVTEGEIPAVDLILCRDALVHFSHRDVWRALRNMKRSGSRYLLTTIYSTRSHNQDIFTGEWRALNLQAPPFNFPAPTRLLDEQCPRESEHDKSLALWKLSDIPA